MTEEEFKKIAIDHGCKVEFDGWRTEAFITDQGNDELVAVFYLKSRTTRAWFTLQNPLENNGCIQTIGKSRGFMSPTSFNKAFDKFLNEVRTARKEIRMMKIKEL